MPLALLRYSWSSTRRNWGTATLLFAVIVASAATLTLALAARGSSHEPWMASFRAANGAHVWLTTMGDPAVLEDAERAPQVRASTGLLPIVTSNMVDVGDNPELFALFGQPAEQPTIGRVVVTDGRWLAADGAHEIVLDRSFARYWAIQPGDQIRLLNQQGWDSFIVVGLAIDPSHDVYPSSTATGYLLPDVVRARAANQSELWWRLGVQLANPADAPRFALEFMRPFPPGSGTLAVAWQTQRDDVSDANEDLAIFLTLFSAFGLLAAAFVVLNVVSGRVLARYREVGLLKAVGLTPGQVSLLFMTELLLIAVPAALLGGVLGLALSPLLLDDIAAALNAPPSAWFQPRPYLGAAALCVLLAAGCTLVPALAAGRTVTARSIAFGFGRPPTRASMLARLSLRLHAPAVVTLGLKDAFARRGRALLTTCALVLAVATLVFTLALNRTLDYVFSDPALAGEPFDLLVTPRFMEPADVERVLTEQPEVDHFATRDWLTLQGPDNTPLTARMLGEGYERFDFHMFTGRMFERPGEAVASGALLDAYGLEVGDELTVHAMVGDAFTVTITGRYGDPDGRVLMTSPASAGHTLESLLPPSYMVAVSAGSDPEQVVAALDAASDRRFETVITPEGESRESRLIRAAMYGLCAVLLGIALVNMVITAIFTVRERRRELGALKALGITPTQLTLSVLSGMAALVLIALLVGVPAGLWLTKVFYDAVAGDDLDASFYQPPTAISLALLVPFMLAITALAGLLPAQRVARQSVAEVLRYE